MPLVLAMNDANQSDVSYEDIPYRSYEYPSRYRKRLVTGAPFVYYRGRQKVTGGRQPQVYLGAGVIGEISHSRNEGRFVCEVLDGSRSPLPCRSRMRTALTSSLEAV